MEIIVAPLRWQEGWSSIISPLFHGWYYSWWKHYIFYFIMDENCERWDVICEALYVPIEVKYGDVIRIFVKTRQ